jgi:actin related protein 2/3 complex subunit 3
MSNLHGEDDIVDETLKLFKANVFFYEFEIKSDADRALIYCMLYTTG